MRRLELALALLLLCSYAYGEEKSSQNYGSTIGIGMSSGIIKKQTELSIGHAFSPNWSVNGTVSIALSQFIKGYEDEEKEHYSKFRDLYEEDERMSDDSFTSRVSVLYWPLHCHKGVYIRLGACFKQRYHTDIEAGGGFCFKIWKGIHGDISYGTPLISSFRNGKISGNGISICIQLRF